MIPIPQDVTDQFNEIVMEIEHKGADPAMARHALERAWNADERSSIKSSFCEQLEERGATFYMATMTRQKSRKGYRWKIELEVKRA